MEGLSSTLNLSILIPVLNEVTFIEKASKKLYKTLYEFEGRLNYEVVLVDGGSGDGTEKKIAKITKEYGWVKVFHSLKKPSILKTILGGVPYCRGEYTLILPIDCELSSLAFKSLEKALLEKKMDYGAFKKRYSPTTLLMSGYAWLQNTIRTKGLKNIVWTNGLFLRTKFLSDQSIMDPVGFLEDVYLSDALKKKTFLFIDSPILVSTRRYEQRARLLRVLQNGLILLLFRSGVKNLLFLKKLYQL